MMAATQEDKRRKELNVYRDTVESIGVAIVLAFVLRAFIVEAFVIPTGSMAPRLLGEHWDLVCRTCGWGFAYGADKERVGGRGTDPEGAQCPNCGTPYRGAGNLGSGDRVLVMKYLYNFREPQPWDVVVFKNPQDNRENYIKRLIGLPGETIEIVHGDIFVSASPDPNSRRSIRRKPPKVQEAMWQAVYNNDYLPDPNFPGARDLPRWRGGRGAASWNLDGAGGRVFTFKGNKSPAEVFLEADRNRAFGAHYGYNRPGDESHDTSLCSDLKLSAVLTAGDQPAAVTLSLSSFEFQFEAEFHTDGIVVLSCRSPALPGGGFSLPAQVRPMVPGRGRLLALTHVDFRAAAWVDGECVLVTPDANYSDALDGGRTRPAGCYGWLLNRLERGAAPAPDARISAVGGRCELSHVGLSRDVYYTAANLPGPIPLASAGDYAREIDRAYADRKVRERRKLDLHDIRHRRVEPGEQARGWGTQGRPIELARNPGDPDLDEFFVLGDNSPRSQDSRMWSAAAPTLRLYNDDGFFLYQLGTVPRYNLLGKAMFVYWPSGFRLPLLERFAIVPNVGKMRFIR